MIEIPESATISRQATQALKGKTVADVLTATSPHRFTFYNGNPEDYPELLIGKTVEEVKGYGSYIDLCFNDNTHLAISDGTNMKYYTATEKCPTKFQLLIAFEDASYLVFTVSMYGCIQAFKGMLDNQYYQGSIEKPPLDSKFDFSFFEKMITGIGKDISVKALLATEQRIPGLGNGVLQDILFNVRIHPKRKINTLSPENKEHLFQSVRSTLADMVQNGGRNTEKDIYGIPGQYITRLSQKTYHQPCPRCGSKIIKEAYLGGSIYYCPECQQ
ncbi:MAG: endonuclease VIII [Bacteroides sp.]|nr:endonuclease VIII [Bacteroides sp.]